MLRYNRKFGILILQRYFTSISIIIIHEVYDIYIVHAIIRENDMNPLIQIPK